MIPFSLARVCVCMCVCVLGCAKGCVCVMENEIDQIHIQRQETETDTDTDTQAGRDMDGNGNCILGGGGRWETSKKDDVDGLVPPRAWVPGLARPTFGGRGATWGQQHQQQHLGSSVPESPSTPYWDTSTEYFVLTRDKGRVGQRSAGPGGGHWRTKCSVPHPTPNCSVFCLVPRYLQVTVVCASVVWSRCTQTLGECAAVPWEPYFPGHVTVLVGWL